MELWQVLNNVKMFGGRFWKKNFLHFFTFIAKDYWQRCTNGKDYEIYMCMVQVGDFVWWFWWWEDFVWCWISPLHVHCTSAKPTPECEVNSNKNYGVVSTFMYMYMVCMYISVHVCMYIICTIPVSTCTYTHTCSFACVWRPNSPTASRIQL